jgi:hypothetical protein
MKIIFGVGLIIIALWSLQYLLFSMCVTVALVHDREKRATILSLVLVIFMAAVFYYSTSSVYSLIWGSKAPSKIDGLQNFNTSIALVNKGNKLVNKQSAYSTVAPDRLEKITEYYSEALEYADKVDIKILEKRYEGWGMHFDQEYREGLRLTIQGFKESNIQKSVRGQTLMSQWGDWFNANINNIKQ